MAHLLDVNWHVDFFSHQKSKCFICEALYVDKYNFFMTCGNYFIDEMGRHIYYQLIRRFTTADIVREFIGGMKLSSRSAAGGLRLPIFLPSKGRDLYFITLWLRRWHRDANAATAS